PVPISRRRGRRRSVSRRRRVESLRAPPLTPWRRTDMTRTQTLAAWLCLLVLGAGAARASSPDPDSRTSTLATTTGPGRICEGGSTQGASCSSSTPCATGTCTGFANVRIAARGLLTIIADTKTPGQGWTTTSLGSCTNPAPFDRGSCEASDNALFTLLLEF